MTFKTLAVLLTSAALALPATAHPNNASPTGTFKGSVNGQGYENASDTGLANGEGVGISKAEGKPHKKKKSIKKKRKQIKKKLKK